MEIIAQKIRNIPDFPKPGIQFKDITPLLGCPDTMTACIQALCEPFADKGITKVAGMESRGFIFGTPVAAALGLGFVPLRKPGKLPYDTVSARYALEYGEAELQMHIDAVTENDKVLLIDDLIATGGTAKASCELIETQGATVAGLAFVIELDFLNGREQLEEYEVHSLLHY